MRTPACACCGIEVLPLRRALWAAELLCVRCFVWAALLLVYDPFRWALA
jgi:hypothetical protein